MHKYVHFENGMNMFRSLIALAHFYNVLIPAAIHYTVRRASALILLTIYLTKSLLLTRVIIA